LIAITAIAPALITAIAPALKGENSTAQPVI
jgi:hypothetical protein